MSKRNNGVTTAKGEVLQACAVPSVTEMLKELEEQIWQDQTLTLCRPMQIGLKLWKSGGSRVTYCSSVKDLAALVKTFQPLRMTMAVSLPHLGDRVLVLFADIEAQTVEGNVWTPGIDRIGSGLRMLFASYHPGHWNAAEYIADLLDLKFLNAL